MAKPSITNIRPPSSTDQWIPPTTTWDLNNVAERDSYFALAGSPAFDSMAAQLNLANTGLVLADVLSYNYIFFGVNGGAEERVTSVSELSGVIATGNGKDHVIGGDMGDLVFTGNGKDVAHGGGGNDILFGENGEDKLFGDAGDDELHGGDGSDRIEGGTDEGTFEFTPGTVTPVDGYDVILVDPTGMTAPGTGSTSNEVLQPTTDIYIDGEDVYLVMTFEPEDHPPTGLGVIDVTVAVYDDLFNVLTTFEASFDEDEKNFFKVQLGETDEHVAVLLGHDLTVGDGNPNAAESPLKDLVLKSQGVGAIDDYVTITPMEIDFDAGDVLEGGLGMDIFQYAEGDGVDEILDFTRGEGDKVHLVGIDADDVTVIHQGGDSYIMFGDGAGGFLANSAIKVTGIDDFTKAADVTFG